jgi:riboflavin synthase alpha subunit
LISPIRVLSYTGYSVTGTIDANGTISGSARQTVLAGTASTAMTFTPNAGYKIKSVTVNGESVTIADTASYTFAAISAVDNRLRQSMLQPSAAPRP